MGLCTINKSQLHWVGLVNTITWFSNNTSPLNFKELPMDMMSSPLVLYFPLFQCYPSKSKLLVKRYKKHILGPTFA